MTCRDDRVQEVRLCLDRDLAPRTCGADVLRSACRDRGPLDLPPVREPMGNSCAAHILLGNAAVRVSNLVPRPS